MLPARNLVPLLREELCNVEKPVVIAAKTLDGFASAGVQTFDSIVCVNVLEHIEDDWVAMCQIRTLLKHESHLCVLVPASPWLYGTLDESFGHYRRYTKGRLIEATRQAGLEIEALP